MRWFVFIVLQVLILSVIAGIFYIHKDRVIILKEPPISIAQWYKPQNKRQVWLHTMFNLRREMLAIEIYAKEQNPENLKKWSAALSKDYQKIAEMVPEWKKRLDLPLIAGMEKNVAEQRYGDVTQSLEALKKNCESCHKDFRAVTAAMYRAPDFSGLKLDDSTTLISHMETLNNQVNQIKIGFVDERPEAALAALAGLREGMNALGKTCNTCHRESPKPYPTGEMTQALATLEVKLNGGTLKEKGEALGTLAVMACANCHGTHRIPYDTRTLFTKKKPWGELLKHP